MHEICSLSMMDLCRALQKKELSAREATAACLERIANTEEQLQALLHVDPEQALRRADELDATGPDPQQLLWGVPVTVKDALSTIGQPTTAASRILENFIPVYDAFTVARLRDAGAILLGKNNMDEFAMGSSTENSAFKKTRNPWNISKVPGGSSGGSAASVASGQCFASLGSDTGGSIRQPAAFCGCVGLKPTYGRVSRYGLFAFASSLDQVGPLTRNVEDCARVLEVIAGHDPRDSTCVDLPVPPYSTNLGEAGALKGLRIGIPREFFGEGISREVHDACMQAVDLAAQNGAEILNISLPHTRQSIAAYYIIAMAEASSNLARYDGVRYGRRAPDVHTIDELYVQSRSQGFGPEVKRRILLGTFVLSSGYYDAYFRKAAQVRRLIANDYAIALEQCDLICGPVSPVTAWDFGSHSHDPLAAYLMDAYTVSVNLAGLPALSLPVGLGAESRLPVGMQLIGHPFGEELLLSVGRALETRLPPLGQNMAPAPKPQFIP